MSAIPLWSLPFKGIKPKRKATEKSNFSLFFSFFTLPSIRADFSLFVRYSYYNGNPWHLTTLAPAEQLYRAVSVWNQYGQVNITSTSLGFFQNLVPGAAVGTYKKGDGNFEKVTAAVSKYADDLYVHLV